MDFALYMQMAIALFTILDPFAVIPIFIALTDELSDEDRRKIIRKTVTAVGVILLIAAIAGNHILEFFGIDIHSFKIAGGILLLLISLNMLQAKGPLAKTTPKEETEAMEKEDIAVVPLAIPLLSGPGAISTVIVFSSSMQTLSTKISLLGIIILVTLSLWPILHLSKWISQHIGRTGINIAIRIMGLILASVAVKFMLEGVQSSIQY